MTGRSSARRGTDARAAARGTSGDRGLATGRGSSPAQVATGEPDRLKELARAGARRWRPSPGCKAPGGCVPRSPGRRGLGFGLEGRGVDRDLVARIRDVDARLDEIGIAVLALVEGVRGVHLRVDDVVPLGHPGDVDPLAAQLLEVPVRPADGDTLVPAAIDPVVARVVRVLEEVLEAERLLVPGGGHGAVQLVEDVIREAPDV